MAIDWCDVLPRGTDAADGAEQTKVEGKTGSGTMGFRLEGFVVGRHVRMNYMNSN